MTAKILTPKTAANLDKLARAISLLDVGHHSYLTLSHNAELPMLVLHGLMKKNVDELNELLSAYGKKLFNLGANEIKLVGWDTEPSSDLLPFDLANLPAEADKKTGVVDEQGELDKYAAELGQFGNELTAFAPLSPVHPATRPNDFRPTASQFTAYQSMFDYFNRELFGGQLPQVILNLSRMSKAHGFFAPSRWSGRSESVTLLDVLEGNANELMHEISLNPDSLSREPLAVLGTLVHEMCHLQRQVTGKPSRGGYHCKIWAEMMLAVGLTPVSLDKPGTMLGQKVTHEIEPAGAFMRAFTAMPTEYLLPFSHVAIQDKVKAKKKAASKTKYTCPDCEANIWGKPGLVVCCADCENEDGELPRFVEEVKDEEDDN